MAPVPPAGISVVVLGCDGENGGGEAFIENTVVKPIKLVLDRLCVQQTRGFRNNVNWPRHEYVVTCDCVQINDRDKLRIVV